jgi:hypothetical protein
MVVRPTLVLTKDVLYLLSYMGPKLADLRKKMVPASLILLFHDFTRGAPRAGSRKRSALTPVIIPEHDAP